MSLTTLPQQLTVLRTRPVATVAELSEVVRDLMVTMQDALNEIVTVVNGIATVGSLSTVVNVTTVRSFDATAATLAETRQVLGTLLEDLGA